MSGAVANTASDITGEEEIDSSARVVNLLQMVNPDQINIEAMVIEINSDDAKKLGMEYSSPTNVSVDTDSNWRKVTDGTTGEYYGGETYGQERSKGSHW